MRILIVAGLAQSLLTFRGPLLQAMRRRKTEVVACAAEDDADVAARLADWGMRYLAVPLRRAGLNPLADRAYLAALVELLTQEQPDAILAYTHKPVIYSALAAARSSVRPRVYVMITGLGFAFIENGEVKQRLAGAAVRFLYRRASRHFAGVIFQNPDDQALFQKLKLVRPGTPQIIVRGSGIDLHEFTFAPLDEREKPETGNLKSDPTQVSGLEFSETPQVSSYRSQVLSPRFLLIARLLGDKGIREYVAAAQIIKAQHPQAEFHLVGPTDPNPAAIKLSEVEAWQRDGVIVYHGSQKDVRPILRECSVYVLPSYREGTPRTVLEAMATGRAVITTDAPGCRETVFFEKPEILKGGIKQGLNGFLVPVKSVDGLVVAMQRFIDDPTLAARMGVEGRQLAEEHYDVHKVNRQMMEFMGLSRSTDIYEARRGGG